LPRVLTRNVAPSDSPIVQGAARAILDGILETGVALAVWTRRAPPGLAAWLDALPSEHLPDGRFVCEPAEVPARLAVLCDQVGLADGPPRALLIDDIAGLAARFARIAAARRVDLRLEALDHDSCWRFHRDRVGLRLNATYRGPGTQWPPLELAARALNGAKPASCKDCCDRARSARATQAVSSNFESPESGGPSLPSEGGKAYRDTARGA
jgi:hypothetical protein